MGRILPIVLAFALAIYAIADCARTPSDKLPGRVPKPLWIILIIALPWIGPIAWIVSSRVTQAEERGGRLSATVWSSEEGLPLFTRRPSTDETQRAPDDDDDFLFALEAQLYRERKERERRAAEADGEADKPGDNEADELDGDEERPQS